MPSELPVAIVTGSSRGIGRAIAEELGRQRHAVVVNYANRADAAAETVALVEAAGGEAIAVKANVADADDRDALVDAALEKFGRLDVLVNNAGITSPGRLDLLEATAENFDLVIGTNLKGPFFLSQRFAQESIRLQDGGVVAGGKIVNISSLSTYAVSTNRADYCMAKAGLAMMTKVLAQRLAQHQILVYEISPGVIETDMSSGAKELYDRRIAEGMTPIQRWGQPSDCARAVGAIVQDYFPFSTGAVFAVDGGFHIRSL